MSIAKANRTTFSHKLQTQLDNEAGIIGRFLSGK